MSFIVLPPFPAIYNAHVCLGNKAPLLFPNSFVVCVVCEVKEINFLGVILDENLNCKSEISHVASKVAKSIGIISRCSFFLPKSSYVCSTIP